MYKITCFLSFLTVLLHIVSCTKTEDLEPLPQDKILEFSVSNVPAGESLFGSVNQVEKTITVYVPFYYGLELIDPEIKLSDGARLSEEILPLNINIENHSYTVIAADGKQNTYKLIIVQQNTPTLVSQWGSAFGLPNTKPLTYPTRLLPTISGNFYSNNAALAKVTLVSRNTKKEVLLNTQSRAGLSPVQTGNINNLYNLTGISIPADIDTGYHDVKIDFLGHHVTISDPVNIKYQAPRMNYNPTKVAKQGDQISYDAYPELVILDPTSVKITANGKAYDFKIVKHDFLSITLQVPDDFPTGTAYYQGITTFKDWPSRTDTFVFTISPK